MTAWREGQTYREWEQECRERRTAYQEARKVTRARREHRGKLLTDFIAARLAETEPPTLRDALQRIYELTQGYESEWEMSHGGFEEGSLPQESEGILTLASIWSAHPDYDPVTWADQS